ncbi:pectin acetylesterase-family hydrolase [Microbacterium hominis]|uniref:Pectin acetylesterase n=1 Tax=Microbacterium hominis TaxID=162426 RepID=A0A7D4TFZ0_9MICO|nr:pectin acetylesterase-family hydrolase [Microbacterium hominis]QKJ18921.1 pectin acetylesterase [Microbacterium hominis]
MSKVGLDPWEREPLWLKALTPFLKAKRLPALPADPQIGKWYRFTPDGAVSANGEPAFADIRIGTENKLVVFFCGGGVSTDEYTAARPASMYMRGKEGYYLIRLDLVGDLVVGKGVLDDHPENPFRNWTKVVLTYATGDFHVGTNDFPYTALDGFTRVARHHGYLNYRAVMDEIQRRIPVPDDLLIAGCSGGAWGAALLADDVIARFPDCRGVTCCIDSALGLNDDWPRIAAEVWGAPDEIVARLHSADMVRDSFVALHRSHGDKVRYLYSSSIRDSALSRLQNHLDGNGLVFTRAAGEKFQRDTAEMSASLARDIPGVGFYFFDTPDPSARGMGLTTHCVIGDRAFHRTTSDGKTARDWLWDAVNGNVRSYGQALLAE